MNEVEKVLEPNSEVIAKYGGKRVLFAVRGYSKVEILAAFRTLLGCKIAKADHETLVTLVREVHKARFAIGNRRRPYYFWFPSESSVQERLKRFKDLKRFKRLELLAPTLGETDKSGNYRVLSSDPIYTFLGRPDSIESFRWQGKDVVRHYYSETHIRLAAEAKRQHTARVAEERKLAGKRLATSNWERKLAAGHKPKSRWAQLN